MLRDLLMPKKRRPRTPNISHFNVMIKQYQQQQISDYNGTSRTQSPFCDGGINTHKNNSPIKNENFYKISKDLKQNNKNMSLKDIKRENTKKYFNSLEYLTEENKSANEVDNLKNLEHMIRNIKQSGFEKCQREFEEKLKVKAKLEKSIQVLKKKIMIHQYDKKYSSSKYAKESLKVSNLQRVSKQYESMGKIIKSYQNEIPNYKPQIENIDKNTIEVNTMILNEKMEIKIIKDQIAKLNKMISDKEKEKDNFRPAIILLNKHINALKLKINNIERQKSEFMLRVTEFAERGIYNKK